MTFEPIWGVIIACYLFLAGLGGGAFLTSAVLRWRHPEAHGMIRAGRIIAPAVVITGLVLLVLDAQAGFHNPWRFALLLSNFGSVMTWGVVFLGAFTVVALIVAILDLTHHRVPAPLDAIGALLGICVAVYTGCLLGVCKTFPLWNNALLPILFLVSAVSTGMAAVFFVGIVKYPDEFDDIPALKKAHFWLPIIESVLVAALLFITANAASPAGFNSVTQLTVGEYALSFWILFIIVGLVLPTILETKVLFFSTCEFEQSRKSHAISATSDVCVLVGGFVLRLLVLWAALPITMVVPWC